MPKRRKVTRIWTKTVVCLADKESSRVPPSAEKEILFKAGLGTSKIQFLTSEADVLKTITSEDQQKVVRLLDFLSLINVVGLHCSNAHRTAENSLSN